MKMNFPEDPPIVNPAEQQLQQQLKKGEAVSVVGASTCRGHLIVEHKGQSYHVPFQYMELLRPSMPAGNVVAGGVSNNPNNVASVKNNNNNSNNMTNKTSSSTGNLTNNCNVNNNVGVNNGNSGNTNNNNASNNSAAVKI